jgi:uncharacterized protein with HEPN domain
MSAVERQLQIISEAAYRLGETVTELCPGPDWKQIRAIGNVLRHDYSDIATDVIWGTAYKDVPALRQAVERTLHKHFPEGPPS